MNAGFALANSLYRHGERAGAETLLRQLLLRFPDEPALYNNLAQVLLDRQRLDEAEDMARRAVALDGPHSELFRRTLSQIETARAARD